MDSVAAPSLSTAQAPGTPSSLPSVPISLQDFLPIGTGAPLSSEENQNQEENKPPLAGHAVEDEDFESACDPDETRSDSSLGTEKGAPLPSNEGEAFEEGFGGEGDGDGSFGAARVLGSDQNHGLVDKGEALDGDGGEQLPKTGVSDAREGGIQSESVKEVSGENPNPEEGAGDGLLGVEENPIRDEEVAAESTVDGTEENGVHVTQVEKDENLVASIKEVVDSKPAEAEPDAAEVEKDGAIDSAGVKEKLKYKAAGPNAVKEARAGTVGSIDPDQNLQSVSMTPAKPLENESSESSVSVGGEEKTENFNGGSVAVNSEIDNCFVEMLDDGHGNDAIAAAGEIEKGGVLDKNSELVDSKVAKDSGAKLNDENDVGFIDRNSYLKQQTGEEKVISELKQTASNLELKPNEPRPELAADGGDSVSPQEVKSLSILAGGSMSRETDGQFLKSLGVAEDGNGHKITGESILPSSVSDGEVKPSIDGSQAADGNEDMERNEAEEDEEGMVSDVPAKIAILESSETAKQIIKELEEGSSSSAAHSGFGTLRNYPANINGLVASDSDEVDSDEEGDGKDIFDSAALAALRKAATGSSPDGSITITSQDGRIVSVDRPAGLGPSTASLRPAPPHPSRPNLLSPSELAVAPEPDNDMTEEEKKLHEKVELIKVKFLRLVQRLGHSPEDTVAAQVLYRLNLAEGIRHGRQTNRAFSFENARKKALQLEAEGKEDLDFSCNILVLGKTGVGKSATINSIFGEEKTQTNAFEPETSSVKEIVGIVDGVKIHVIDTPGLRASVMDQSSNRKILSSLKKYTKKCPPDIVLYIDRVDTQTRDLNDLPLLRTITSTFGSSIWFNAIVAFTHAASAPPDGPNGSPLSYEMFIAQRSHVVQQSIRQAAGDMRLMNPVALVENHPSCRSNREGQRVLPNGVSWRSQMLLLCYSSKILSEANSLLKLQDPSPGKLFGFRFRSPPLPYLLSSLLQSRAHPKLPTDQGGENGDSDIDLDDLSDADNDEEEDEYDQLPPFKPLRKSQIAKLTKEQKRAYFDEYDYRVKLLQKKQWKEELRRLKELKKRGEGGQDTFGYGDLAEDFDQDNVPAAVAVPLPDMILPPSFDCDSPTYRYRFLEPTSQLLARPVLDTHSWDHDCGYDGVSLEESLALASKFPAAISVQVTKDKKEFSIHLDSSISAKHGENGSTVAGFDIQTVGKQLAYILRGETKFKNLKKNKTAAGMSVTFLGETVATGVKIEDHLSIGKRVSLVASTGAMQAQGDTAYGANLEAHLQDKDYPISQALSTLGLSLMRWRGDLALGANLQSQFSIGRNSKMAIRVGLNNKLTGQITVRTSTSEQLQIALVGILPIAVLIFRGLRPGESHAY